MPVFAFGARVLPECSDSVFRATGVELEIDAEFVVGGFCWVDWGWGPLLTGIMGAFLLERVGDAFGEAIAIVIAGGDDELVVVNVRDVEVEEVVE